MFRRQIYPFFSAILRSIGRCPQKHLANYFRIHSVSCNSFAIINNNIHFLFERVNVCCTRPPIARCTLDIRHCTQALFTAFIPSIERPREVMMMTMVLGVDVSGHRKAKDKMCPEEMCMICMIAISQSRPQCMLAARCSGPWTHSIWRLHDGYTSVDQAKWR